jgi:aryl-alcohol dehydrogenase-like predicted oxidoreductase
MPSGEIITRQLGHTDIHVSALTLGGHHLGNTKSEQESLRIVDEALDGGITTFDNCWEYHLGASEVMVGKALRGKRDRAILMTKVCTHGRDKDLAMQMLEQSLKRLQTDHLDIWQIHGVTFYNDPELFMRPNGAAEALTLAKKQGKVRAVGFTGHKDPRIHMAMLDTKFPFDTCQFPLNPLDAGFRSFEQTVLPECNRRGIGVLGMKPMGGTGDMVTKGVVTAEECLRYAMSLPVATTVAGVDKIEVLHQNLAVAQSFRKMEPPEMQGLRDRVKEYSGDGRFELYKTSIKYDNPEARLAHGFPLDAKSNEVQEMISATKNDGHSIKTMPQPPK